VLPSTGVDAGPYCVLVGDGMPPYKGSSWDSVETIVGNHGTRGREPRRFEVVISNVQVAVHPSLKNLNTCERLLLLGGVIVMEEGKGGKSGMWNTRNYIFTTPQTPPRVSSVHATCGRRASLSMEHQSRPKQTKA